MEPVNLISVRDTATRELTASGARLVVRISGKSLVTGSEAFKKAAEVAACVAAVTQCGVPEEDIRLAHVSVEVESGLLTHSSSATYYLEIHCRSLDLLGPVLAAVSSQKNAKVAAVAWQYRDLLKIKHEVLQEAVRAAKASATVIADSLSVALLGVHKLSYDVTGLDTEVRVPASSAYAMRALAAKTTALETLTLSHTTSLAITVTAEFLVAPFGG
jgi:uncharacterized protein YggE